jgi:hypothetical protein
MQQAEFRGCYIGWLAAHRERHGVTMQFEIRSGNARSQRLLKTSQNRSDAGREFSSPEWLRDVIIGAKVQAAHAIFLTCSRSKKDDGNVGQITALANLPADFKAAVTGNHNVQQKKNRWILARLGQNFVARNTKTHIEPGHLQVVADQIANVRIVF